jgi:DeoR family deoxyribose operon repressor
MTYEKQNNRIKNILRLLQQKEKASVAEIATILNVSDMTVRRDLKEMEKEGFIKRTHGGAVLSSGTITIEDPYIINKETTRNIQQKSRIGEKAASLICPNETVFFDSGSTTFFVAKFVNKRIPFTAVCYTFKNAIEFYKWKDINLILSGGFFHRDSNVFQSINGTSQISSIRADKAFISSAGVDEKLGLTTYFYFEADIKKAMITSAKQRILVVDSSKFGKVSITFFANLDDINIIITDEGISEEYKKIIKSRDIELYIV